MWTSMPSSSRSAGSACIKLDQQNRRTHVSTYYCYSSNASANRRQPGTDAHFTTYTSDMAIVCFSSALFHSQTARHKQLHSITWSDIRYEWQADSNLAQSYSATLSPCFSCFLHHSYFTQSG